MMWRIILKKELDMENNPIYKTGNKGDYIGLATDGHPEDLRVSPCPSFYEVEVTGGRIMESTVGYDIAEEPLVIGKATIDRILQHCDHVSDCIALYTFYYYTAKWQKTSKAKASVGYCSKGLKISQDRIRKAKKELIKLGLVSDFKRVDSKTRKVLGWYVLVKFVKFKTQPSEFPHGGDFHSVEESETNALSTDSLNALNTNNETLSPVGEVESSNKSKRFSGQENAPESKVPPAAIVAARRIAAHVKSLMPTAKNISPPRLESTVAKWAVDIDRLNRLDGRSYDDIHKVITFAVNDEFWRTNILSGSKLREKYDMLWIKSAKRGPDGPTILTLN
jgi:hypothetical protein